MFLVTFCFFSRFGDLDSGFYRFLVAWIVYLIAF